MFIKQVILDGFKSYADRTIIEGWDPVFNAITGFNGTGKSNILDAICWVMGINKTERMRVQNQKQLIYKEGQTRVTKASVTVVFDNKDKERSPVGYQNCEQITVTRMIHVQNKGKYYVNGANAQASRVRDLFHSVSLDVNNPHFLIMQGMVTKVLNYGEKAILGMIEEAAGTKMYMEKKLQAEKTMREKNVKMQEIKKILEEQINPQLQKLRMEKRNYQKFQENNTMLQKNAKKIIALEYWEMQNKEKHLAIRIKEIKDDVKLKKAQLLKVSAEMDDQNSKIQMLQAKVDLDGNTALLVIQRKKKTVVTAIAKVDTKEKVRNNELLKSNEQLKIEEENHKELKTKASKIEESFEKLKNEQRSFNEEIKEIQENVARLEAQKLGLGTGKSGHGSAETQLIEAKKILANSKQESSRVLADLKDLEREIDEKRRTAEKEEASYRRAEKDSEKLEGQIKAITRDVGNYAVDENLLTKLLEEQEQLEPEKEELESRAQNLQNFVHRIDKIVQRSKLGRHFDYSQILGRVIKLIDVPKKFYVAFQEIGRSALHGVCIKTASAAAEILASRATYNRVTFYPLDRYSNKRGLSEQYFQNAARLGSVWSGVAVAKFRPEIAGVVNAFFGKHVICEDKETAQRVMERLGCNTVSLCGTTYSPGGEVAGGRRSGGPGVLQKIADYKTIKVKLDQVNSRYMMVRSQANQMGNKKQKFDELQDKLRNQTRRYENMKNRLQNSEFAKLQAEADALQKSYEEHLKHADKLKATISKQNAEAKKLKKSIEDMKRNRAARIKEIAEEIKQGRSELRKLKARERKEKKLFNELEAQTKSAAVLVAEKQEEILVMSAKIKKQEEELAKIQLELKQAQKRLEDVEKEEAAEKENIENQNAEILSKKQELKELARKKDDLAMRDQELRQEIDRELKNHEHSINTMLQLGKKHQWIEDEKENFNKPGSVYDFSTVDLEELRRLQNELERAQEVLDRKLNKKVMHMLDSAESEFNVLHKKRETVKRDKQKIETVISDLDCKKDVTLNECFKAVSRNFEKIFSMLLKGARATLKPVKPDEGISSGVDILVALGNTWKQSLSELSGGQRSLLALSLILAIAAKNPAPIYILDEIDAALDPSHTQNIGLMLQKQFKSSQFVVVSLKDGMFENANVLFRTEFVEGVSQVRKVRG